MATTSDKGYWYHNIWKDWLFQESNVVNSKVLVSVMINIILYIRLINNVGELQTMNIIYTTQSWITKTQQKICIELQILLFLNEI